MAEAGVFAPDARLELIDGEIFEMAPIGSPHAGTLRTLVRLFVTLSRDRAVVSAQSPLIIGSRSVPEPDLALLKPRTDDYRASHPAAADALLVVEVSDTTLAFDAEIKAPMYLAAGVPECWVIDINSKCVRVFRPEGSCILSQGKVTSIALPDVAISFATIFPAGA